jgi:hypothetical protein
MRRILVSAAIVAALVSAAAAADVPTLKAPANNLLTFPFTGDGFYWGFAAKGGAEQNSASGSLLGTSLVTGNVNAMGAGVGGDIGYMRGMGVGKAIAFENTVYYQNVTGAGSATTGGGVAVSVPASFASRWSADQVVKVFGWNPLDVLSNINIGITFPTFTFPTVPGIKLAATSHGYWEAGIEEWGISGQFFTANSGVSIGVAAKLGAGIMNQIVDSTGKLTGGVLDVGCDVVFADKGLQASGLFAPGSPVVATLTSGRKYECATKIDF